MRAQPIFLTIAISSHFLLRCFLNWLREMLPEEKSKNQKTRHSQSRGCSSKEIAPPDFTEGEIEAWRGEESY